MRQYARSSDSSACVASAASWGPSNETVKCEPTACCIRSCRSISRRHRASVVRASGRKRLESGALEQRRSRVDLRARKHEDESEECRSPGEKERISHCKHCRPTACGYCFLITRCYSLRRSFAGPCHSLPPTQ